MTLSHLMLLGTVLLDNTFFIYICRQSSLNPSTSTLPVLGVLIFSWEDTCLRGCHSISRSLPQQNPYGITTRDDLYKLPQGKIE